ncbi:MAG: SDR family oxidoreductase [Deltaproteobacteria bacterium]|nr:SDR family oxidoreductase [Deltaproteobacteria bacterium]
MFRLDHKTAIVTGAGSGIGKAIALLFARQGAAVHMLDVDETGGGSTAADIAKEGGQGSFHPCDVTDQAAVTRVVDAIVQERGGLDILANVAGIAHVGNAENTGEADFDRLMRVNVKGVYNGIHAAIPHMKAKGGSIVNIASVAATVGLSDRFAYSTTKGAIAAMTRSVAKDFIGFNIRCNAISPGRVHTPFVDGFLAANYPGHEKEMFDKLSKTQPIGRMGKPGEIAILALYLCSDEASFITGCDYPIDGGFITLNS